MAVAVICWQNLVEPLEALAGLRCVDPVVWFCDRQLLLCWFEALGPEWEAAESSWVAGVPGQYDTAAEAAVYEGHEGTESGDWGVAAVRKDSQDPGGSSEGKTEDTEEPCGTR